MSNFKSNIQDRPFSTVIADKRFAGLGLLLMGNLARIQKLLKALGFQESQEQVDVAAIAVPEAMDATPAAGKGEDFGEKIVRNEVFEECKGVGAVKPEDKKGLKRNITEVEGAQGGVEGLSPLHPPRKKRRKKQKGDAFDELFDVLS